MLFADDGEANISDYTEGGPDRFYFKEVCLFTVIQKFSNGNFQCFNSLCNNVVFSIRYIVNEFNQRSYIKSNKQFHLI